MLKSLRGPLPEEPRESEFPYRLNEVIEQIPGRVNFVVKSMAKETGGFTVHGTAIVDKPDGSRNAAIHPITSAEGEVENYYVIWETEDGHEESVYFDRDWWKTIGRFQVRHLIDEVSVQ